MLRESPSAGKQVHKGSTVTITIGALASPTGPSGPSGPTTAPTTTSTPTPARDPRMSEGKAPADRRRAGRRALV